MAAAMFEQRQLVLALEHARLEHHLLAVAHLDAELLEREQERRLDHVDAERHRRRRPRPSGCRLISRAAFSKSPAFGDTAPRMPTMPASDCFAGSRGA